jgi:AraC-like DNA-binding protein
MSLIIDTSDVAPSERFDLWAEQASKVFFPMGVQPVDTAPFSGRVDGCRLGPVGMHRLTAGRSTVLRTARTIGDADPETFQLALERRGRSALEQDGRSGTITPGGMFSYQTSRPFVIRNETPFQMLVISFPTALLRPYTDRVCRQTGLRIDSRLADRLVGPFLRDLDDRISSGSLDEAAEDLGETVVDLVRSVFTRRDEVATADLRYSETLLPRVTSHVYRHLGDPGLTPARIAEAHFISTRSLHRLFEPRGVSVAEWIRELRLARCRRDLADPALAGESVGTIAARWGMQNPAHFSRLYRAAYGCRPSDHRGRP